MGYRLALLVLLGGCGARSGVEVERCQDAGTRPCTTVCGEGAQVCVEGLWAGCEVPTSRVECNNDCGIGTAACEDSVVGVCEVPATRVACSTVCGTGTAVCTDGTEGVCEVPSVRVECSNACGNGSAVCAAGVEGTCDVPPVALPCENVCGNGLAQCEDGAMSACQVPERSRPCSSACGDGVEFCSDGAWGPCSADVPLPPVLEVTVRDFLESHPDFEAEIGMDRGIVNESLGADDKPIYVGMSPTTHGPEFFEQWYRDVPGVNLPIEIELPLTASAADPGRFVFADTEFFPIDGRGFGDEGREHNFHFTLEAVAEFVYNGGETFRFLGDDDVFVYINRRLAINLGGVHGAEEALVDLDASQLELGLRLGGTYSIHLFFAERHTSRSSFTIDTTITRTIRCE